MIVHGWTLLFHDALTDQLDSLVLAVERAQRAAPNAFRSNASANTHVKLLAAIAKLILEVIPEDPGHPDYCQGNTLGRDYRHWFRAKFFGRFRLFFRYDSRAKLIVFAWVNDETTLRQRGGKHDPYAVFRQMLEAGDPPNDWAALVKRTRQVPDKISKSLSGRTER